jgi:hypothetical protein
MPNADTPEQARIHLPPPSLAPIIVALGAALALIGVLVRPMLFVGLLVLLIGVGGWVFSQG